MDVGNLASIDAHDAEVTSIKMSRLTSACRLGLSHADGKQSTVELVGIAAFRVEDFGLQNIVSRVLRSASQDFSLDDLNHWLGWVTSLSDAPSWLKPEKRREWVTAVAKGELELVVMEPSAGAQIAAVCERVTQSGRR